MSYKNLFEAGFKTLVIVAFGIVIKLQMDSKDKIVYVDSVKLMSRYKGMEIVKKTLENKSQNIQSNLDTLRAEFERTITEINQKKSTASKNEIKRMEEVASAKQQQYINYEQSVKEQFLNEEKELSSKLMDEVNNYIRRYGEKNDYAIILASSPYGNIAYADNAKDITEEVVAGLNSEFDKLK